VIRMTFFLNLPVTPERKSPAAKSANGGNSNSTILLGWCCFLESLFFGDCVSFFDR